MSADLQIKQEVLASADVSAVGDKGEFVFSVPVEILRFGLIVSTLLNVGGGVAFTIDTRVDIGSDSGRVAGTEDLTLGLDVDVAVGDGVYRDLATPLIIRPGESAVFEEITEVDTAVGNFRPFVHYRSLNFQSGSSAAADDKLLHMTKITS